MKGPDSSIPPSQSALCLVVCLSVCRLSVFSPGSGLPLVPILKGTGSGFSVSQSFIGPKSVAPPQKAFANDCDFSRNKTSPLLFGWHWALSRQKIASICDVWCSQVFITRQGPFRVFIMLLCGLELSSHPPCCAGTTGWHIFVSLCHKRIAESVGLDHKSCKPVSKFHCYIFSESFPRTETVVKNSSTFLRTSHQN